MPEIKKMVVEIEYTATTGGGVHVRSVVVDGYRDTGNWDCDANDIPQQYEDGFVGNRSKMCWPLLGKGVWDISYGDQLVLRIRRLGGRRPSQKIINQHDPRL